MSAAGRNLQLHHRTPPALTGSCSIHEPCASPALASSDPLTCCMCLFRNAGYGRQKLFWCCCHSFGCDFQCRQRSVYVLPWAWAWICVGASSAGRRTREGGELQQRLVDAESRGSALTEKSVSVIMRQLMNALAYFHSKHVAHK